MSGEVHYFRVARAEWGQRLDLLVEAGCDTVASYIPWIFHELPDGTIDVTGETRPERDIGAFIDLAAEKGLRFIARPGPFIMAELKNEGIPFRVYRDHPEIVPLGWDGEQVASRTVDYLAPAFLAESGRWFDAIMPVLAPRLQPARRPDHRRPARQRDRHARLGDELARPHRRPRRGVRRLRPRAPRLTTAAVCRVAG